MSMPNNTPQLPVRRGFDAYTAMLAVSLLAVTLACVFLYLELAPYGPIFTWWKVPR
jgi:hypothetical protein